MGDGRGVPRKCMVLYVCADVDLVLVLLIGLQCICLRKEIAFQNALRYKSTYEKILREAKI